MKSLVSKKFLILAHIYMDVNQAYGKFHGSNNEAIVTPENEAYGQTTGRDIVIQNIAMKRLAQFNTEDMLDNDYI